VNDPKKYSTTKKEDDDDLITKLMTLIRGKILLQAAN